MKGFVVRGALAGLLAAALSASPAPACTSDPECDDGLVCNGVETCNLGTEACENGTPVVCPPPGQCEESVDCQEPSGDCAATPKPDDIICDDGNVCTQSDTCQGGVCTPGPGGDADADGDCDAEEVDCGCNPNDDREICALPNRLLGRYGNRAGEVLLQWFAPDVRRVDVATDASCATAGQCTAGYCTRGRIRDVCATDAECDLPPDTCRLVANFADVPDASFIDVVMRRIPVPGFTPLSPGCSRKVDVVLEDLPRQRLRLRAQGTVEGRTRRDRDVFRFDRQ